jgi:glycine/D-amino acid oxidase-like deaminating enzyme/nitrite reductase/ring-hydroxylating ferredoxin subunit
MENHHSGRTVSLWMATQELPAFEPLQQNVTTDVCIVGAGIAGLTTAYQLLRQGRKVVVLDDGPIVSGETERTTAHLASALDDRFTHLEKLFGEEGSRLAAESHMAAINTIEAIVTRENIDCDFARLDGYLFVPEDESPTQLKDELAAARRAGHTRAELVPAIPVASFRAGPAIRFPDQGQFHPLKYLAGLAAAIQRDGGAIFANTHATTIEDGDSPQVHTQDGYVVSAKAVVVASNSPINDRVAMHTKQAPYRTYVIAARIPSGSVPQALYWDTLDPYHYVRLQKAGDSGEADLLIVGGEDHKTGQAANAESRFARLEAWTRERFPVEGIEYYWSGQVMEPVDSLAFIGRNPGDKNVYIATGDSGHGMTHGTIAGLLLTDLICERANAWTDIYDPARKTLRSLGEFAKENLNVAARYTDHLRKGEVRDEAAIPLDSGAVIRHGGKKVAVYCDESGQHHACSAVCPHLGCVVSWNAVEKSWDCPCHGSRFDPYGKVVNGPANEDLEKAAVDPHEEHAHA